jgi:mannose-6-phosphate isomerase-like protein (cupin superfamily)
MNRTLALAAVFATCANTAWACPPTTVFNTRLDHLDGYRIFTGADGTSQVEPYHVAAKIVPMLKTGKQLQIIQLPNSPSRGNEIVVGPANVELPLHPTPYKEMFIMLGGSVTLKTKTFHADLGPGSVMLFDDAASKDGHGGRTGPCGYVSMSIVPQ